MTGRAQVIGDRSVDEPGGEELSSSLPGHAEPCSPTIDLDLSARVPIGSSSADADRGSCLVWNVTRTAEPSRLIEVDDRRPRHHQPVSSPKPRPSEVHQPQSGSGTYWLVDIDGGRLVGELARFPAAIAAVDHLPDGTLAVLTAAGQLAVLDPTTPSSATTSIACCDDGFGTTIAADAGLITSFDQRPGDAIVGHTIIDVQTGRPTAVSAAALGIDDAGPLVALPNRRAVLWDSAGEFVWVDESGNEIDRAWPFGRERTVRILSGSLTGTHISLLVVLDDLESPFPTGFVVLDLETGDVRSDVVPFDPNDRVVNWGSLPDGSFVGVTVVGLGLAVVEGWGSRYRPAGNRSRIVAADEPKHVARAVHHRRERARGRRCPHRRRGFLRPGIGR